MKNDNYLIQTNLHILIVEDDRSLRKYLVTYFKKRGIKNIYEASSGSAALEICSQKPINFIISDWNMPNMSGIELLENIRSVRSNYGDVPFMMITVSRSKNQIARAGQGEVDDYLIKPFRTKFLEERFDNVLLKKLFDEYVALAFQNILKGEFEKARDQLLKAHLQRKSDTNVLCGLTICNSELENVSEAQKYFNMIIEESSPLYSYTNACLYQAKGFMGKALLILNRITKYQPDFIYSHIKAMQIYIKLGNYDKAQEIKEKIDNLKVSYTYDFKILHDTTM